MKSVCLAAALVLAAAVPAFAADNTKPQATNSPAKSADAAKDSGEKLICTRETPTGSTIPRRVCRTQAQVDAERRVAAQGKEQMQAGGANVAR